MYMCFEFALCIRNERREEVGLVIRRETVEDVMEFDGTGRSAPFRAVNVILRQSGTRFILVVQKRAQGIYDSRLADIVGADEDVQSRLERDLDGLQLPEVANAQFA